VTAYQVEHRSASGRREGALRLGQVTSFSARADKRLAHCRKVFDGFTLDFLTVGEVVLRSVTGARDRQLYYYTVIFAPTLRGMRSPRSLPLIIVR
jgi:hypothetical protein